MSAVVNSFLFGRQYSLPIAIVNLSALAILPAAQENRQQGTIKIPITSWMS